MANSFFGLNVAVRGLYTAQKSLDITNHNLNNINTPGYSRQQGLQVASRPMAFSDGTGMIGTGSDISGVIRIRDEFLDFKFWGENVSYGEWDKKTTLLSDLQATFNEPSDSGFTTISNEFYNSLNELAKDPGSRAIRAFVVQKGVTVAKYFNSLSAHLDKLQIDANYNVYTKVEEINSLSTQINQLNRQIYISELDGNAANDLRDQRTYLVDRLSKIVNIEASEVIAGKLPNGKDDKHFIVTISGKALINHFNISKLTAQQRATKLNPEDTENLYEVKWADGNRLEIKGGELKAYMDVRDGNETQNGSPLYKGIPFYQKKLNEYVQTFAMSFNEGYTNIRRNPDGTVNTYTITNAGHSDGYDLNTVTGDPPSNIRFFTMTGADGNPESSSIFLNGAVIDADIVNRYNNITAKNFAVSSDIVLDNSKISTSDTAGQKGNINILNALIKLRHDTHMFSDGGPEDFMKSLVATLGIDSQQAERLTANQDSIIRQIASRRTAESGVSLDEEMANMVKFQHAYNASAKMIQTMSEVYDTLINRLGV